MLFLFAATLFATACNKEDNNQTNEPQGGQTTMSYDELILGNWDCIHSYQHVHREQYFPPTDEWFTDLDTTIVDVWTFYGDRWKFTDNGTWYVNASDYGTYVVSSDMLALTHPSGGNSRTHYSYIIAELTNNKLVLSDTIDSEFSQLYGYDDDTLRRKHTIYRFEFVKR